MVLLSVFACTDRSRVLAVGLGRCPFNVGKVGEQMRGRVLGTMVVVAAVIPVLLGACQEDGQRRVRVWLGTCSVTEDCHIEENWVGGSVCVDGLCVCPDPDEAPCCPGGRWEADCEWSAFECRPRAVCLQLQMVEPGGRCTRDEECVEPIDWRCGASVCRAGRCAFEVAAGERSQSQYLGDCRENYCDFLGDVKELASPSDVPFDNNPCTADMCEGEEGLNLPLEDGVPCPGVGWGICVLGKCQECSQPLGIDFFTCPAPGEICDSDRCAPASCANKVLDGGETDLDCGGAECAPCASGRKCVNASDCTSNVCQNGVCKAPTHDDGVKNGSETGVDCGYPGGPLYSCKDGEGCRSEQACVSRVCWAGVCQKPTCFDYRQNQGEKDVDCGGPCVTCPPKT